MTLALQQVCWALGWLLQKLRKTCRINFRYMMKSSCLWGGLVFLDVSESAGRALKATAMQLVWKSWARERSPRATA